MQPMQPEQAAMLLNTVFLPSLKNEHKITKTVMAAIPLDKGDYRPDEISKTALELAWHIVATEIRFIDAILNGAFDFTPMPRPDSVKNSADLGEFYASKMEERIEALPKMSSDQLMKIIDFRGMFQMPAVTYLNFVMHHTIHHRGQLSMYLRPMGAKVPSIYGESYDASEARKAAAQNG